MKILINFKNDFICFYNYDKYKDKDLSKTNILDLNEFVLSKAFINDNYEFVLNFIKNNLNKRNIKKVYIDTLNITEQVLNIIKNFSINYIYINEEKNIDTNILNYVFNNENIKTLNCYNMSKNNFDRINLAKKINIIIRKKYTNNSYIYRLNNINSYSDIYYKKEIFIDKNLNKNELNEFKSFLKINNNLRFIELKYFNKNLINNLLSSLKDFNKKNIKIIIIESDNNIKDILSNIKKIKKYNKKILRKNNIIIDIKYEYKYIRKNILSELNLNIFKFILMIILLFCLSYSSITYINNKKNTKQTKKIEKNINNIIESIEIEEPKEEVNVETKKEEIKKKEEPKAPEVYLKKYSQVFSELKKINNDTIGWIKVNNTGINYPVVQTNDNNKYLNISFDGSKNPNGWIFMDYRNNSNDLGRNTILYGHSGNYYVMFGSLKNVLKSSWYTNPNNQVINYNNSNSNNSFKIFSIYLIDNTNDYLITDFSSNESYKLFIDKIKGRSIYDFGIDISENDKILTLSTCYGDNKRLVVHAKKV